jgi:hypothetical protein
MNELLGERDVLSKRQLISDLVGHDPDLLESTTDCSVEGGGQRFGGRVRVENRGSQYEWKPGKAWE